MDDKGDVRLRAIAELALAVETGGDVEQAVQAACMAGVEPYEIAELAGCPSGGRPRRRTDSRRVHPKAKAWH